MRMRTSLAFLAASVAVIGAPLVSGSYHPSPPSQPNLQVSAIVFSPSAPEEGESVRIDATVVNAGNADAGAFRIDFLVNGTLVGNVEVTALAAGQSAERNVTWGAVLGSFAVVIQADGGSQVPESVEDDNSRSGSVTVRPTTAPDLTVTRIAFVGPAVEGDNVSFVATVKNVGNRGANDVRVRFDVDGVEFSSATVPSLGAGNETTVDATWRATLGAVRVSVGADPDDAIPEKNEDNNTRSEGLLVIPRNSLPDLAPAALDFGGLPLNDGDLVRVRITVVNRGGGEVDGEFETRILLDDETVSLNGTVTRGAPLSLDVDWNATVGNHTIAVIVDPDGKVREGNESDNRREQALRVLAAGQRPDIAVKEVRLPPGLFSGDDAVVTAVIENKGNAPAEGIGILFDLQLPGLVVDKLTPDAVLARLEAGAAAEVPFTLANVGVGARLAVISDPGAAVRESNETNNALTVDLGVRNPPADLTPQEIVVNPALPKAGDAVILTVKVANLGRGPASQAEVRFLVDNVPLGTVTVPEIAMGQTVDAQSPAWTAAPGNHVVTVKVNEARSVNETDHSNNEKSSAFLVTATTPPKPTPGPELAASAMAAAAVALLRRKL